MGQASIGRAALVLTTDAAKARTGLADFKADATRTAQQTAESVRTRFSGMLSGIKGGFAAGLGIGLVGGVKDAIGSVAGLRDEIDRTAKQARRLGTDTATWQGLVHAANLSGVSIEELETGLRKFRTHVEGPLDQALFNFARSIEGVGDAGERAAILTEVFGKSGVQLATLFEGGEKSLRSMVGEVRRYGAALSDVDAARVEAANDALSRAKLAVHGVALKVTVALAPAVEFLANELVRTIDQFRQMELTGVSGLTRLLKLTAMLADATRALAGATIFLTGARLKFFQAELIARGAQKGGIAGAALGALGAGVAELFGAKELRQAGDGLMKAGTLLMSDVGGATKRAEALAREIEARKVEGKAAVAALGETAAGITQVTARLKDLTNPALLRGTSAEVSARLRFQMQGGPAPSKELLAEQRRATKHLQQIESGVRQLNRRPAGPQLATL
jgi:hypothetical protein